MLPQIIKSTGVDHFEFLLTISCAEQSYRTSLSYLKKSQDIYDFVNEKAERKELSNTEGSDDEIDNYIDKQNPKIKQKLKKIRTNSSDSEELNPKKSRKEEISKEIKSLRANKPSIRTEEPIEQQYSEGKHSKKRSLTKQEEFRNFEHFEEALRKKTKKASDLKAKLKEMKKELSYSKEENSRLTNENQRYALELDTLKDKGVQNDLTNKIVSFQKEICNLRQRYEEERAGKEKYERQLEESDDNVRLLEERIYRMKQKQEEEVGNLLEKLSKRKDKIEALNSMIEERDKKLLEGMKSHKVEYREKELYEKESTRLGGELSRLINAKFEIFLISAQP